MKFWSEESAAGTRVCAYAGIERYDLKAVVKVCLVRPGESLAGPCRLWMPVPVEDEEMIKSAIESAWEAAQDPA
jgi:hypothetical protein